MRRLHLLLAELTLLRQKALWLATGRILRRRPSYARRSGLREGGSGYGGQDGIFGFAGFRKDAPRLAAGCFTVLVIVFTQTASAALTNRYVDKNCATPSEPYDSWENAATDIQTAINYAYTVAGETVLVAAATYDTGGVTNYPTATTLTNRIAIYKAITVRSANNDPTNTIIKGAWDPITTNGPAAVRCVYMTNRASLIGFMLTNGATLTSGGDGWYDRFGGGVHCQSTNTVISNCVLACNSANGAGGAWYGTLYNSTLISNSAPNGGGGVYFSTLYDCTLTGNSTSNNYGGGGYAGNMYGCTLTRNWALKGGGGARLGILSNCTLAGNSSGGDDGGGGAFGSILYNCVVSNNAAKYGGGASVGTSCNCLLTGNLASNSGGGAYYATVSNCTLTGNSVPNGNGGGAHQSILYNCLLSGNSASSNGGGTHFGTLYNCTLTGNSASNAGGGTVTGGLYNCIVYFNTAPTGSNWFNTVFFTNSCTTPTTTVWAAGNITNDPMLVNKGSGYGTNHVAGTYRLAGNSPCINAGTNQDWMTNAYDLDGRARIRYGIVDMGAYERVNEGTVYKVH